MGYDVIVVGARVAGAATAMLLARSGLKVLAVDRARFPSDTLSTHQVQLPGVARLGRWGVLERLVGAGTPPCRRIHYDAGAMAVDGCFPTYEGFDALYSPRRTLLDAILVDAARSAGAEVRESYAVSELIWSDGAVAGIRGHGRGGRPTPEAPPLVTGADGERSMVAAGVAARRYRERPVSTMASYTYFSGVPMRGGELYQRPGRAVAAFPTDDGLTMVYMAAPLREFADVRADVEGSFLRTVDRCGDLGERVRAGRRAERFRTSPDLPHTFRVPRGPGWALVGDAGLVMDPVSAQGIGNALRQAEMLSNAIVGAWSGAQALDTALDTYWRRRDDAFEAMYDFTTTMAQLRPLSPANRQLLGALRDRPEEVDRFLGVFAGVTPLRQYRSPGNLVRLLGARGLARAAVATVGSALRPRAA